LKTGLSAGWRGFAVKHKLANGDAVVFQLVEKTKFKVIFFSFALTKIYIHLSA